MGKPTKKAMEDVLIYLNEIYNKDWDKIYGHLSRKQTVDLEEVERVATRRRGAGAIMTIMDKRYPLKYRTQPKPPFVIEKKKGRW